MTESDIQFGLWLNLWRKGQRYVTPNALLFVTGEMDMCSLMKSGKVNEFEIKISRSDFKADFKKDKHRLIQLRRQGITIERRPHRWGVGTFPVNIKTANYFHYVVPDGLIEAAEVPEWAGLMYVSTKNVYNVRTVKRATQIHDEIYPGLALQLGDKLMHRFWDARSSIRNAPAPLCSNCKELRAATSD